MLFLQLWLKGGIAAVAVYNIAAAAGDSIGLGEHVKLEITSPTLDLAHGTADYK